MPANKSAALSHISAIHRFFNFNYKSNFSLLPRPTLCLFTPCTCVSVRRDYRKLAWSPVNCTFSIACAKHRFSYQTFVEIVNHRLEMLPPPRCVRALVRFNNFPFSIKVELDRIKWSVRRFTTDKYKWHNEVAGESLSWLKMFCSVLSLGIAEGGKQTFDTPEQTQIFDSTKKSFKLIWSFSMERGTWAEQQS